jgi:hypothetical protein
LLLARKAGLSAADAFRLLKDTSAQPSGRVDGEGSLVDACAAMISLAGQGSCTPTTDSGHRMAGRQDQRFALH